MPRIQRHTPGQLKMFMGGRELKSSITTTGDSRMILDQESYTPEYRHESLPEVWNRKTLESRSSKYMGGDGAGVRDSIKEKGYDGPPVQMFHRGDETGLKDGHHRVAAAADIESTTGRNVFVPVSHSGR